jgi:type II secretory pathway component PulF
MKSILEGFNVELPAITQIILALADITFEYYYFVFPILIVPFSGMLKGIIMILATQCMEKENSSFRTILVAYLLSICLFLSILNVTIFCAMVIPLGRLINSIG